MAIIDRVDWLESFVAVADYLSFSAASESLHCSQSRVSTHVSALERAIGYKLVDRSSIPCRLTEKGIMFHARAVEILEIFAVSVAELHSESGKLSGTVVLGTIPSISAAFIPHVAKRLRAEEPSLELNIVERTSAELGNLLNAGILDLAIGSFAKISDHDEPSTAEHGNPIRTLWVEPYVVVFPEDSPHMLNTDVATPEQLVGLPLAVTGAPGAALDPEWEEILDMWDIQTEPARLRTEQPQTLINLGRAGLVVPVMNYLAYQSCDHQGLRALPIQSGPLCRQVRMHWSPKRYRSLEVQKVIETVLRTPPPAGLDMTL
ncbi:DNA-binding transcriptional LysR family regulator [Trueperella bonasi]|uniref:DNA-binding transcriptional LysR family regulator n=1 Tax=Trueperella bonasi TaxID=312286 RepID=A0ABT9NFY7_9ACTO|nr:LysR family transcriptional regulator [Trueperella bonasi]MDP9806312.1 DNA-binding transcriptional LysR family regulator [Trueperella bonasi]